MRAWDQNEGTYELEDWTKDCGGCSGRDFGGWDGLSLVLGCLLGDFDVKTDPYAGREGFQINMVSQASHMCQGVCSVCYMSIFVHYVIKP